MDGPYIYVYSIVKQEKHTKEEDKPAIHTILEKAMTK